MAFMAEAPAIPPTVIGTVTVGTTTADIILIRTPRPGGAWVHFSSPYGVTLGAPDTLTAERAMALAPAELAYYLSLPR